MTNLFVFGSGGVGSAVLEQIIDVCNPDKIGTSDRSGFIFEPYLPDRLSELVNHKRREGESSLKKLLDVGYAGGTDHSDLIEKIESGDLVINTFNSKFNIDEIHGLDVADIDKSIQILKDKGLYNVAYDVLALTKGATVVAAHKDYFASPEIWNFVKEVCKEYDSKVVPTGVIMGPTRAYEPIDWLKSNKVEVQAISGIMNGTCNFMLTKMFSEKLEFSKALDMADEEGFVDPWTDKAKKGDDDTLGYDALAKIKASGIALGFYNKHELYGIKKALEEFMEEYGTDYGLLEKLKDDHTGIKSITQEMMATLKEKNYTVKLICSIDKDDGTARVGPKILKIDDPIAQVNDSTNVIKISTKGEYNLKDMVDNIYGNSEGDDKRRVVDVNIRISGKPRDNYQITFIKGENDLTIIGPGAGYGRTASALLDAAKINQNKDTIYFSPTLKS